MPGAADMVPVHEFIDMDEDEREGRVPYIWAVDGKNRLLRMLLTEELAASCDERRNFWRQLKSLVGFEHALNAERIAGEARAEMAQKLTSSLLALASSGGAGDLASALSAPAKGNGNGAAAKGNGAHGGNGAAEFEPVWVETPECTACDECIEINPKIFAYNDDKQAVIVDPTGGPFKDIVKAAEKCTAGCIHPGTPFNPGEPGVDKLVQRAEKFQ